MKRTGTTALAGALILAATSCGETRDSTPRKSGSGADGGDRGDGATGTGGRGGKPSGSRGGDATQGGAGGESLDGSVGGNTAPGGGTAGDGRQPNGASGSSDDTNGGGPAGTDPGSTVVDTHKDERERVAHEFCSVLEKYPCLTYAAFLGSDPVPSAAPVEQKVAACEKDTNLTAYTLVGEACWSKWVDAATCQATKVAHACPCSGEACWLSDTFVGNIGVGCDAEASALNNCVAKRPSGVVNGSRAQCGWQSDAPGSCFIECTEPDFDFVSSRCSGPPSGPFRCPCLLNGRLLHDDATEDERWFYADSCQAVGQKLADGECFDGLNCCFTWTGSDGHGGTMDYCSCTSDPTQSRSDGTPGFASCEAAAAAGHGKIVDVCPKYAPNWSAYPTP